MPSDSAFSWRIVALLFAGSLAARILVIWTTGFDGLYGQDAYAYFNQAMALREALVHGAPVAPGFSWPPGFPALAALMSLLVGPGPVATQLVSLLMGSAVAPLTFLIGRRIIPSAHDGAAFLAAAITAIGGLAVLSSIVSISDATALALILLSMWCVLEFENAPSRWELLLLAVAAGGAAVATRWAFILVGPALAVPALKGLGNRRGSRFLVAALVAAAGAGFTAFVIILVKSGPFDFSLYFRGWSLLNAVWGPIPEIPAGSLAAKVPGLIYYLAPLYHPAFIGPLLCPFAIFGLWHVCKNHDRYASLTLILWTAVPLMFFVGLPLRSLRFGLTIAVPFALCAGYGAWKLQLLPRFKALVRVVVAISCVLIIGWGVDRIYGFIATVRETNQTIELAAALVPDHAVVLAFDITLALEHRSNVETIELFNQDPASLKILVESSRPVFLLIQPDDIERRWKRQAPGINIRWLMEHGSLEEIAAWGPYSLQRFEKQVRPSAEPTPEETTS